MRKGLFVILLVLSVSLLALKLFTYRWTLKDDPTTGLAWRARPGLSNLVSSLSSDPERSFLRDENAVPGEGLYEALVRWGWWVALLLTFLALAWVLRRRP